MFKEEIKDLWEKNVLSSQLFCCSKIELKVKGRLDLTLRSSDAAEAAA